ncbi:MAG: XRE family transcriptional regulator [Clostridium sp.]|uniref:helix-turn-helix domain-containing protein n=1 Tax=Intestinibacter bartlettii TaxID=261299 RepID=UPI000D79F872|nr:helix-turn-helix transcriptional regulator [Intestinibacter bartlettii]MDU2694225.1 helix-turn-helix transcriptional regulator [Intestinibacter bartlettii]PWM77919.1 MAG: XRE family transcriptional regulator [Clostridium sp.]
MSFGKRLKNLRIEKNLTQQQLAEKLNVSKANISKYESDIIEPNINLINQISKLFDVSSDYLLGITIIKKPIDTLAFHSIEGYENLNDEDRQYIDDLINRLNRNK